MVQDFVCPVRVHKYPFEMVMAAYERRFPNCPLIPIVVECVITEDSWSTDNSQRHTTRRCQLAVEAPFLIKRVVGEYIYFIQNNHLDLQNRILNIQATNESFSNKLQVLEKCRYYVHPENPEWTCFDLTASLDVKSFFGIEGMAEKIGMKQYSANLAKGKDLIDSFMQEVNSEGVTELAPWSRSDPKHNAMLRAVLSRGIEPLSAPADLAPQRLAQSGPSELGHSRSKSETFPKPVTRSKLHVSAEDLTSPRVDDDRQETAVAGTSTDEVGLKAIINKSITNLLNAVHTTKPNTEAATQTHYVKEKAEQTSLITPKAEEEPKDKDLVKRSDASTSAVDQVQEFGKPGLTLRRPPVSSPKEPKGAKTQEKMTTFSQRDLFDDDKDQYTLDSEYIKRHLGELTPMQESRLLQLRKWIADLQKGKVPSDTTLLRFLRARDFNVEKAREMLSQSLLWRKKHQVDRILSEYETPDVVKQYFPGGWHHHDKDGRPLYVLRLGQMDVKGLLKSIGEDGLLKLTLHVCEEGLKLFEEATSSSSRAIQSWCLLVDLDGLNMRHLWRPGVRALLRVIQVVEGNYPETMGRVLIVRAPRVFPILWTIVSTFIDENTRSKFLFYGGKDYLQPGGLLDYIPKDLIPDFLGGPCKVPCKPSGPTTLSHQSYWTWDHGLIGHSFVASAMSLVVPLSFVHEGGLLPKSLYVSGAFTERDGDPLSEDSIYRSVSLAKGQVHEVCVSCCDPQSVLTWDFDVLRHDIAFTVFRCEREPSAHHTDTTTGGGGVCDEGTSLLEQKGWREGEHYRRVEPTLVCHDGESIQGSHVMMESGCYVLQWRCELLDSAHRAAQLMYFHETLASHHYRGSMSSLQSGTSGFSCLSGKSVSSSCPSR